tara:strand:- start:13 stop:315 length:303 start_codon:yes stop_codon:yes gene_type:complete
MAAWLAKIGAGLGKVSPEAWKAGALVTDKLSGGAGGGIGKELANANVNLSGGLRNGTKGETKNGASKGAKSIAFGSGDTEKDGINASTAETSKTNLIGKG